jgi:hypothetical protein
MGNQKLCKCGGEMFVEPPRAEQRWHLIPCPHPHPRAEFFYSKLPKSRIQLGLGWVTVLSGGSLLLLFLKLLSSRMKGIRPQAKTWRWRMGIVRLFGGVFLPSIYLTPRMQLDSAR